MRARFFVVAAVEWIDANAARSAPISRSMRPSFSSLCQLLQPLQAALACALAELPLEQRRALKLHLVGGMTTTPIGVLMRVHHSTVVRWLAVARAEARATALEALRLEIGGSVGELASLAGLSYSAASTTASAAVWGTRLSRVVVAKTSAP